MKRLLQGGMSWPRGYSGGDEVTELPKVPEGPAAGAKPSLPKLTAFQRLRLEPGDVLVVSSEMKINPETVKRIKEQVREAFGDAALQVVVLDCGLTLSAVNAEAVSA